MDWLNNDATVIIEADSEFRDLNNGHGLVAFNDSATTTFEDVKEKLRQMIEIGMEHTTW